MDKGHTVYDLRAQVVMDKGHTVYDLGAHVLMDNNSVQGPKTFCRTGEKVGSQSRRLKVKIESRIPELYHNHDDQEDIPTSAYYPNCTALVTTMKTSHQHAI